MADLVRARGVQVMPGALELLAEVAEAGLPHALVTSAEPEIMAAALDSIGVRFPVTVCAADVARGKPDPEPYLRAAAPARGGPRAERRAGGLTHRHQVRARRGLTVVAVPSVPPPPGLARLTVPSLRAVDLATLREAATGRSPGDP